MNIEHRYICKLIKELEEKDAKIESMENNGDNTTVAELKQENLVLSKQVEYSAEKQAEQEENVKKLRSKLANLKVENGKLKNENWELFTDKDNQDKLSKELQKELKKMESLVNKDIAHLSKKDNEISDLEKEKEELEAKVADLEEQLKENNTNTKYGNTYDVYDIFKKIKKEELITSLKSTIGKAKGSELSSHPFVLELGNCCAFFNENKFVACMEHHKDGITEYIPSNTKNCSKHVITSIKEYMGLNMDFKIAQRKDLCGHSQTITKTLSTQILINKDGYICSTEKYTWYIYQENDGSKFVVLPNGEKEVV